MKKNITADEFQLLELKDKARFIFAFGEELFCRLEEENRIKIYNLFDFYVEVNYKSADDKIRQIEVITDNYLNENYLSEIDISDLYN